MSPWKAAVLAIGTWLAIHLQNDFGPADSLLPTSTIDRAMEGHFSDSYYQARALFRRRAQEGSAQLQILPMQHLAHLDLTVDVAVVAGANDRVLVHLSGTHGVEGFAGSAIQSRVLEKLATQKQNHSTTRPTIVFIHAVNPFGFAMLRRFNEHNVDLNRNWLSEARFDELMAEDPNKYGYMDLYDFLNPTTEYTNWGNWFWTRAAFELATKGFRAIKKAAIVGNYQLPHTVYYGGTQMQPSLVAIRDFLSSTIDFAGIAKLGVIDVHTGLGRSGEDTLMIMPSTTKGVAERVFVQEYRAKNVAPMNDPTNPVVQGYEDVEGFVPQGISELIPSTDKCEVISVAQEFGTVPGVFVLKATIQENAFFNKAPSRRLPYAERLRDVFYTHSSASWKSSVLSRGLAVFEKLQTHLAV